MKTFVVSLGGSVIAPFGVDVSFLRAFRRLVLESEFRFVVVCGGGRICRDYQKAASSVYAAKDDLDWIGVYSTRLNAQLIRSVLSDIAHERIVESPMKVDFKKVLVASGWKPGWSTDYVSVLLAKKHKVGTVVNVTNKDFVYDKNPDEFKDAKPLRSISWSDFRRMFGDEWIPGLNVPFDPVASKAAQSAGIKVVVLGKDVENLESFLKGGRFKGTVIGD